MIWADCENPEWVRCAFEAADSVGEISHKDLLDLFEQLYGSNPPPSSFRWPEEVREERAKLRKETENLQKIRLELRRELIHDELVRDAKRALTISSSADYRHQKDEDLEPLLYKEDAINALDFLLQGARGRREIHGWEKESNFR